jgi:hypothetical protein
MSDFKLLDCTIRDGGYVNNWNFTVAVSYSRKCSFSDQFFGIIL